MEESFQVFMSQWFTGFCFVAAVDVSLRVVLTAFGWVRETWSKASN
jgi:hypothetical protein